MPLAEAAQSLRWATRALRLMERSILPRQGLLRRADHFEVGQELLIGSEHPLHAVDYTQAGAGAGATDMSEHVTSPAAQSPNTLFVIGGYSQGASATDIAAGIKTGLGSGTAIPSSPAPRVAAVVTTPAGPTVVRRLPDDPITVPTPASQRDTQPRLRDCRVASGGPL